MASGSKKGQHPRKRFYRARAHSNPLSDSQFPVPVSPAHMDWSDHFPAFFKSNITAAPGHDSEFNFEAKYTVKKENLNGTCSEWSKAKGVEGDSKCSSASIIDVSVRKAEGLEICKKIQAFGDEEPKVHFADIGCGFGGLLVKLSPMFPNTLMVGMELRDKVSEYVKDRIIALRKENPGQFQNISIIRTNAMKYLQNYFQKGQLQKMFFLFPDPHFKERNHRRRIISIALLAEYAHVMALGGILYTVTDVEELGEWMKSCLEAHPLFEEVPLKKQEADPVVGLLKCATEEGQKVERNGGKTFYSVYCRVLASSAGA
ncbi:hypothetical protein KP509_18G072300 [Ceratopteris richardii]|uniref:tRNA (guanine-N(7)-)-methyltransferase n=1 Tax=Ceratopteris richardii TaxID=49495 RepID=A0A8T2SRJ3_CERRI|nr:hypothetical protein KP509_18G072300 [Ceratopteris richardii]